MNRQTAISDSFRQNEGSEYLDWIILLGLFLFAFFLIGFLVQKRKQEQRMKAQKLRRQPF